MKENKLKLYKIPVTWNLYGQLPVLAESREQAFQYAEKDSIDCDLPYGVYVDDSFTLHLDEFDEDGTVDPATRAMGTGANYWAFLCEVYTRPNAIERAERCLAIKTTDPDEIQFQKELREAMAID